MLSYFANVFCQQDNTYYCQKCSIYDSNCEEYEPLNQPAYSSAKCNKCKEGYSVVDGKWTKYNNICKTCYGTSAQQSI